MLNRNWLLGFFLLFVYSYSVFAVPPPPPTPPPSPGSGGTQNTTQPINTTIDYCADKIRNYNETDIDCGSNCRKCEGNMKCELNRDCDSNYCNPNMKCSVPSCTDGWKNNDEANIDCGGICTPCQQVNLPQLNQAPTNGSANQSLQPLTPPQCPNNQNPDVIVANNSAANSQQIDINESDKILVYSVVLNIILLILFITFFALFAIKRPKARIGDKIEIINDPLKKYINESIKNGNSPIAIKDALRRKGWIDEDIEKAFNELKIW